MKIQFYRPLIYVCCLIMFNNSMAEDTRRIIGGNDARIGDWPWMVSLQSRFGNSFCGAVLIHPYWLLTAAHCLDSYPDPRQIQIKIGLYRQDQQQDAESIAVHSAIVHPQWDTFNFDSPNDLALIRLEQAAKAPPIYADIDNNIQIPTGTMATTMGWGVTQVNHFSTSNILQQVTLPIVNFQLCQQSYQGIYTLFNGQLCAGFASGGKDSCFGDSGGPLVYFDNEDWRVAGIASFGGTNQSECAGENLYGIYTNVKYYRNFISQTIYPTLSFDHRPLYHAGEQVLINLQENQALPREHIDIWLLLQTLDAEHSSLYFMSGSPAAPRISQQALAWQRNVPPDQHQIPALNIKANSDIHGRYALYAVYTAAGKPLVYRHQRSHIAVAEFILLGDD